MSDVLEIPLRADDRTAHDRLRRLINLQDAAERMARWRHFWTALVAAASVPLFVSALRRSLSGPIARGSVALWAISLLAAIASGVVELNMRRRLRPLLAQAGATTPALD
jgi:hypothetical protein